MHHRSAREIDRLDGGARVPNAVHEARHAPDHVSQREINHEHPDSDEKHDGAELHAFRDRPDDQRRRDDGEHQLIHRKYILRNPVGIIGVGHAIDALEEEIFRSTEKRTVEALAENQAVAESPPEDRDQTGATQALRHDGKDVLRADEATVEKGETRQGHEENQRGTRHHPGIVAGTSGADRRCRQAIRNRRIAIFVLAGLQRGRRVAIAQVGFETGDPLLKCRRGSWRSDFRIRGKSGEVQLQAKQGQGHQLSQET